MLEKHNAQTRQTRESTKTFELRLRAKLDHNSKICRSETGLAWSEKTVPPLPTVLGSPERKYLSHSATDVQSQSFKSKSQQSTVRGQGLQLEPCLLQSMNTCLDSGHLAKPLLVAYSPHPTHDAARHLAIDRAHPLLLESEERSVTRHGSKESQEDDQSSERRKLIRHSSPQKQCERCSGHA